MKVWVGYYIYESDSRYNFRVVQKVFDDEAKAKAWMEDKAFAESAMVDNRGSIIEFREYHEFEVE